MSVSLRAVADPTRRKILQLLSRRKEVTASEIEERVKLAQPTISHHMKVLSKAKLVLQRKEGTWVWYRRDESAIKQFKGVIREI